MYIYWVSAGRQSSLGHSLEDDAIDNTVKKDKKMQRRLQEQEEKHSNDLGNNKTNSQKKNAVSDCSFQLILAAIEARFFNELQQQHKLLQVLLSDLYHFFLEL